MKKPHFERISLGLAILAVLIAQPTLVSCRKEAPPAAPSGGETGVSNTAVPALDSTALATAVSDTLLYLSCLEKLGFAGAVLVAKGKAPLLANGFGLADRESGFPWTPATVSTIGSITKQFTGAGILKLQEDGRLNVSDPIGRYFENVPSDKATISLHHLLTHSSGLSDPEDIGDFDAVSLDEYLRHVLALPLLFTPGTGYEYANANFSLLGAIIEKLSGKSYEAFLRERLFLPAGMYETGYILPAWGEDRLARGYRNGRLWGTVLGRPMAIDGPFWALRANGGIHSTLYDMFRWTRALLEGHVLNPASMKAYWTPHVREGGDTFYGYGWSIDKAPGDLKIVTHNGGNGIFFADIAIVPDSDLVIFLMSNVFAESRASYNLLRQIGMRFLGSERYPAIPEVVDVDPAVLKSLAGTYALPGEAGAFLVTLDGDKLYIEAEGREAFSLLNSVRDTEPGRLRTLDRFMDEIIVANQKGDFGPLNTAYGGRIPMDQLEARWAEITKMTEGMHGPIRRIEVLGSATTQNRDETVVRFQCEQGPADLTYIWDLKEEGRLLGTSVRGLTVKLRLQPSGEGEFFTWDDGIRPAKIVRFERGADGWLLLKFNGPRTISAMRAGR